MPIPKGPPGHIPRAVVARRLNITPAWVYVRFDGKTLHPVKVDGCYYYDPKEVEEVAKTYRPVGRRKQALTWRRRKVRGQLAAQAFALFDEGCGLGEIVGRLYLPPEDVEELYEHWRHPLEAHLDRRKSQREQQLEERRRQFDARLRAKRDAVHRRMEKLAEENERLKLQLLERENEILRVKAAS